MVQKNGDENWGIFTIVIVCIVPFGTRLIAETLKLIIQKWRKEPVKWSHFIASLKKVSRHMPVVQIFVHIYYFYRLSKAKNNMEKSLQFCRNIDQEEITNENREIIRNDMEKAERVVERDTRAKMGCR